MMTLENILKTIQEQNYYERLGLTQEASSEDIKRQFKRLALQYHPDKHPGEDSKFANLIFGLIHDAYETLKDPALRLQYDHLFKNGIGNLPAQANYKRADSFEIDKTTPFSRNHHFIAISDNYVLLNDNGHIRLCNNRTGELLKTLSRSEEYQVYYGCSISEEENKIFATHSSGDIDVFDIATGKRVEHYIEVNSYADGGSDVLRIDNQRLLVRGHKHISEIFRNNNAVKKIINIQSINDCILSPNKQFIIAVSGKGGVFIYNASGSMQQSLPTTYPVYTVSMSANFKWIAYGGYSDKVILYNVLTKTSKVITINSNECHTLHFSPNSEFLAIGEYNANSYFIYSLAQEKIVYRERMPVGREGYGFLTDIFFTNNNRLIVNAYYTVYNLPLPENIKTNNHALGEDILLLQTNLEDGEEASVASSAFSLSTNNVFGDIFTLNDGNKAKHLEQESKQSESLDPIPVDTLPYRSLSLMTSQSVPSKFSNRGINSSLGENLTIHSDSEASENEFSDDDVPPLIFSRPPIAQTLRSDRNYIAKNLLSNPGSTSSSNICFQIFCGISAALGAVALIIAFGVLNVATAGTATGIALAIGGGIAFFGGGIGLAANHCKNADDKQLASREC